LMVRRRFCGARAFRVTSRRHAKGRQLCLMVRRRFCGARALARDVHAAARERDNGVAFVHRTRYRYRRARADRG
jgi:hypothetical protein